MLVSFKFVILILLGALLYQNYNFVVFNFNLLRNRLCGNKELEFINTRYNDVDFWYKYSTHNPDYFKDVDCYYINLNHSVHRKESFTSQADKYGLTYTRINAESEPGNYTFRWSMSKSEKSCTTSHIKAIREFWNSGKDYTLIFEDDISFDYVKYQKFRLVDLLNLIEDGDIIQLQYVYDLNSKRYKTRLMSMGILSNGYDYGAAAYLITRGCAEKVLNFNGTFWVSDESIYTICNPYILNRPYFTSLYSSEASSTIRSDSSSNDIARKNVDDYYKAIDISHMYIVNLKPDIYKFTNMIGNMIKLNYPYNDKTYGYMGSFLPYEEDLIELNLFSKDMEKYLRYYGAKGCNYGFKLLLDELYTQNIQEALVFEDDISFGYSFIEDLLERENLDYEAITYGYDPHGFSKIYSRKKYSPNNHGKGIGGMYATLMKRGVIEYLHEVYQKPIEYSLDVIYSQYKNDKILYDTYKPVDVTTGISMTYKTTYNMNKYPENEEAIKYVQRIKRIQFINGKLPMRISVDDSSVKLDGYLSQINVTEYEITTYKPHIEFYFKTQPTKESEALVICSTSMEFCHRTVSQKMIENPKIKVNTSLPLFLQKRQVEDYILVN